MRNACEKVIKLESGCWYLAFRAAGAGKVNLLFIHGLGESGLSFAEAFTSGRLEGFNLFAPDLLGCGRSTCAVDGTYGLETQAERLRGLMDALELRTCYLIGHSMGGDIASLMAHQDDARRIRGIVNIEGTLTPEDLFISSRAVRELLDNNFDFWYETEFKPQTVLKNWGGRWASCRRYYASLEFCRPQVFAACAGAIVDGNKLMGGKPLPAGQGSAMGRIYADLRTPKVFCWGSESLSKESREYLKNKALSHKEFKQAFHWPMIDRPDAFYAFVKEFISGVERDGNKDDGQG
jgi:pimeloyl-ACP methyl ester carboxylesterase